MVEAPPATNRQALQRAFRSSASRTRKRSTNGPQQAIRPHRLRFHKSAKDKVVSCGPSAQFFCSVIAKSALNGCSSETIENACDLDGCVEVYIYFQRAAKI